MDSNGTNTIYGLPITDVQQLVHILYSMPAAQKEALIEQIKEQNQRRSYDTEEKKILLRKAILQAHGEQGRPLSENVLEIFHYLLDADRGIYYEEMEWAVQANDIEAMRLLTRARFNRDNGENEPIKRVTSLSAYGLGLRFARKNDTTGEMCRMIYEEYSRTRKLATRSLHCVLSRCWEEGSHKEIRYFLERGASRKTINRFIFCWLLDYALGLDEKEMQEVAASIEVLLEATPSAMARLLTPDTAVLNCKENDVERLEKIAPKFLQILSRLWEYDTNFISLFFRLTEQKRFIVNYMLWYAITEAISIQKGSDAGTGYQAVNPKKWRLEDDEKIAFLLENGARLTQKDYVGFREEFRKGNLPQSLALKLKQYGYAM